MHNVSLKSKKEVHWVCLLGLKDAHNVKKTPHGFKLVESAVTVKL